MASATAVVTCPISAPAEPRASTAATAVAVHALFLGIATLGATHWLVRESLGGMKFLFFHRKDEIGLAIATLERLVTLVGAANTRITIGSVVLNARSALLASRHIHDRFRFGIRAGGRFRVTRHLQYNTILCA